ncbi:hypothetical protein Tco_0211282 [Tanacetum coccineum]
MVVPPAIPACPPCKRRGGGDVTAVVTWSWHGRGGYGDEGGGDDAVVRCGGGGGRAFQSSYLTRGGGDVTAVVTAVVVWSWHGRGDYGDEGDEVGQKAAAVVAAAVVGGVEVAAGEGGEWRVGRVSTETRCRSEKGKQNDFWPRGCSAEENIFRKAEVGQRRGRGGPGKNMNAGKMDRRDIRALEVGFSVLNPDMSSLYLSYLHGRHAKKRLEVVLDPRFGATSDPSISVS